MSRWSFKNVPVLCGSNYLRCVADRVLGLIRGSSAKRWIVFYWKLSRWLWCLWQYVAIVKITWLTFLSSWCQLRECHAGFDLRCNLKSSIGRKPWSMVTRTLIVTLRHKECRLHNQVSLKIYCQFLFEIVAKVRLRWESWKKWVTGSPSFWRMP